MSIYDVTFLKGGKFPVEVLRFDGNTAIPGVLTASTLWDMLPIFVDLAQHETAGTLKLDIGRAKLEQWQKRKAADPRTWHDVLDLRRVIAIQIDDNKNARRCAVYVKLKHLDVKQGYYTFDVQSVSSVYVPKKKKRKTKP